MLQRIQTIYLLVIVILSCVVLFSPIVGLTNTTEGLEYIVGCKGIFLRQQGGDVFQSSVWGLAAIAALVPVMALVTVFLYKKRSLQIRLSVVNMFLMAGFYALLFVYVRLANQDLHTDWNLKFVVILPLVNMVFNYLALRGVAKDEALVKSLDRLR
ncbi:MAG TPA: DUF4293 domain-containing protein [Paludibacter sp.]|nr:DUF4293 domain-containing protein [Paludibacter sp.]